MVESANLTSRELQALSTRAVIVDAAEEHFLTEGYAGASLGAIATAAKVSKGLILHHFHSKEQLWAAVVERITADCATSFAAIAPTTCDLAALRRFFHAYDAWLTDNPEHIRLLLQRPPEDVPMPDDPTADGLREWMGGLQQAGILRTDISAEDLVLTMLGLLRYRHAETLMRGFPVADADHLLTLFLEGAATGARA